MNLHLIANNEPHSWKLDAQLCQSFMRKKRLAHPCVMEVLCHPKNKIVIVLIL